MLENRMLIDSEWDYIESNDDYDSYLEHLLQKDDEYWEDYCEEDW